MQYIVGDALAGTAQCDSQSIAEAMTGPDLDRHSAVSGCEGPGAKLHTMLADEGSDSPQDAMFEHLCATLLQQSHLCPVPLEAQPVFWNYDHALHLYPIPDVLVLADRVPCASFGFPAMPADQLEQSCICLNPVSSA